MVYYIFHCMSLHVCPVDIFILDSHLANFRERNCSFGCFDCGAVALCASFFPFGVLDERC